MRDVDNPLVDKDLEEQVLSSMMGGKRVCSLEAHHFTSHIRQIVYLHLRSGVRYEALSPMMHRNGMPHSELVYLQDLFQVPTLPRQGLVDAVAELKRLHVMRLVCGEVDKWRLGAPVLEPAVALRRLQEVIRRHSGNLSQPSNGSSEPSPR